MLAAMKAYDYHGEASDDEDNPPRVHGCSLENIDKGIVCVAFDV